MRAVPWAAITLGFGVDISHITYSGIQVILQVEPPVIAPLLGRGRPWHRILKRN